MSRHNYVPITITLTHDFAKNDIEIEYGEYH